MIKIPKKLFPLQKPQVYMYVLDIHTIGLSRHPIPDWRKVSLFNKTLFVGHEKGNWLVKLPKKVTRFYQYDKNTKEVVSISGGQVFIIVTRK